MQVGALRPYERSLVTGAPLRLHDADGRVSDLDVARWLEPADAADRSVVARAVGPALDVGCGPGRILAALAGEGLLALGIDIASTAVRLTRQRGLMALQRDVFGRLPGEGRWATIVLLDGNLGIGGDPCRLLTRAGHLLTPNGRVLVETESDDSVDERLVVRFTHDAAPIGPSFPWARVGHDALAGHSADAGLRIVDRWHAAGRSFAELHPV